jgi:hypothetical protein
MGIASKIPVTIGAAKECCAAVDIVKALTYKGLDKIDDLSTGDNHHPDSSYFISSSFTP